MIFDRLWHWLVLFGALRLYTLILENPIFPWSPELSIAGSWLIASSGYYGGQNPLAGLYIEDRGWLQMRK